ncbi:MAG: hypothetical protein JSW06_02455 [Thermoplasmatales archaeon]|nr:MAG: hypothetical protein JSW06_02455 [Thermoplasmatales archaeon]
MPTDVNKLRLANHISKNRSDIIIKINRIIQIVTEIRYLYIFSKNNNPITENAKEGRGKNYGRKTKNLKHLPSLTYWEILKIIKN